MLLGYFSAWKRTKEQWDRNLQAATLQDREPEPELKKFILKNMNIPTMESYLENMRDEYWETWEKREYKPGH